MSLTDFQKRVLFTDNYIWAEKKKGRDSAEIAREIKTKFGSRFKTSAVSSRFSQLLVKPDFTPDEKILEQGPPSGESLPQRKKKRSYVRRAKTEDVTKMTERAVAKASLLVDVVLRSDLTAEAKLKLLEVIL